MGLKQHSKNIKMKDRIDELEDVISAKDAEITQLKKELEEYKSKKEKSDIDEMANLLLEQIKVK
jgi:hypothetical protein